jgi:NAD kinase
MPYNASMARQRKVIIVRNPAKTEAEAATGALATSLGRYAEVAGMGTIAQTTDLLRAEPDRIIVLGGDGSILAVARALEGCQVPVPASTSGSWATWPSSTSRT